MAKNLTSKPSNQRPSDSKSDATNWIMLAVIKQQEHSQEHMCHLLKEDNTKFQRERQTYGQTEDLQRWHRKEL